MVCPLCEERRAKRSCPALGKQICSFCCGTKRLVDISCPSDCVYLASAREHPAATVVRQKHHDVGLLASWLQDFNTRQSQLLFFVLSYVNRYEAPDFQRLIDADVVEAFGALAATFETASRGVIYEHRPASLPADRLVSGLKLLLAEAAKHQPSSFDRDAALVLRRVERAALDGSTETSNRRAWLELLARIIKEPAGSSPETSLLDGPDGFGGFDGPEDRGGQNAPRLIVP